MIVVKFGGSSITKTGLKIKKQIQENNKLIIVFLLYPIF